MDKNIFNRLLGNNNTETELYRRNKDLLAHNERLEKALDIQKRANKSIADPLAIAKMTIAVNDGYGEKQRTDYINITCFGRMAENCEKYLSKGSKIAVAGKIQTGSYEKDGKKVYTTDIIASNIEFLGGHD